MLRVSVTDVDKFNYHRQSEKDDWIPNFLSDMFEPKYLLATEYGKMLHDQFFSVALHRKEHRYRFYTKGFGEGIEVQKVDVLEVPVQRVYEIPGWRYGSIILSGRMDAVRGNQIIELKSTSKSASTKIERYADSFQGKAYLDMYDRAKRLVYYVVKYSINDFYNKFSSTSNSSLDDIFIIEDFMSMDLCRYKDLHDDVLSNLSDYLTLISHLIDQNRVHIGNNGRLIGGGK